MGRSAWTTRRTCLSPPIEVSCLKNQSQRSKHHLVAPLFEDVWIDKALIDSVFEGTHPARVFVDDSLQPATALMCCERGDYFFVGDTA